MKCWDNLRIQMLYFREKNDAGSLLEHLIFYSTKFVLKNLLSLRKETFLEKISEV